MAPSLTIAVKRIHEPAGPGDGTRFLVDRLWPRGVSKEKAALAAWLNPQLGKHERVIAVEVRDALPKTMIGKLDRKALRAELDHLFGRMRPPAVAPDAGPSSGKPPVSEPAS